MTTYFLISHWHWWGLAALLILGELLAPCFYFLAWALVAAMLGVLVRFVPELSGLWQLGIFFGLSAIALSLAYFIKLNRQNPSESPPVDADH